MEQQQSESRICRQKRAPKSKEARKSDYYGYVADTGAKIYVLDEGKGETVATALADGNGSYSLQVPTGSYKVLIVSAHNKSRDTLQDKEGYKEKFSPYGIYLFSEMISKKDVTVRKNQTVNVSARFEISDF